MIWNQRKVARVFDYVNLLYHKCHEIYSNRSESYIDSPDEKQK